MARRITITEQDHEAISRAIKAAERHTSGEIFAVVAHRSDDYFYIAGFMAAMWSLALGVVLAMISWLMAYPVPLPIFVAAQLASLILMIAMFRLFPELRMLFVPRPVAYRRASNSAVRQFLTHGVHATQGRTGLLLFMSIAERYAEVVADTEINANLDQADLDRMVADMTTSAARGNVAEGFVSAIERAGQLMAPHFPPHEGRENELDDRLIEI